MVEVMPTEITVKIGERVELNCSATGVGAKDFKYQWLFNSYPSVPVGKDAPVLVIDSVSEDNVGSYSCEVTNSFGGSGRSEMAKLYLGTYKLIFGYKTLCFIFYYIDQYCNPIEVKYTGFNVTWNATLAGNTVEAPCTGPGLNGQINTVTEFVKTLQLCTSNYATSVIHNLKLE